MPLQKPGGFGEIAKDFATLGEGVWEAWLRAGKQVRPAACIGEGSTIHVDTLHRLVTIRRGGKIGNPV